MTSAHLIFIPAVLVVGIFIGFLLGSRVAQDRLNLELKRQADREEARRKRAERKAGAAEATEPPVASVASAPSATSAGPGPTSVVDTVKAKKKTPPR
jgi:hypothetical protein